MLAERRGRDLEASRMKLFFKIESFILHSTKQEFVFFRHKILQVFFFNLSESWEFVSSFDFQFWSSTANAQWARRAQKLTTQQQQRHGRAMPKRQSRTKGR